MFIKLNICNTFPFYFMLCSTNLVLLCVHFKIVNAFKIFLSWGKCDTYEYLYIKQCKKQCNRQKNDNSRRFSGKLLSKTTITDRSDKQEPNKATETDEKRRFLRLFCRFFSPRESCNNIIEKTLN